MTTDTGTDKEMNCLPKDIQAMILKLVFEHDYRIVLDQLRHQCEGVWTHIQESLLTSDGKDRNEDCCKYACKYEHTTDGGWDIITED